MSFLYLGDSFLESWLGTSFSVDTVRVKYPSFFILLPETQGPYWVTACSFVCKLDASWNPTATESILLLLLYQEDNFYIFIFLLTCWEGGWNSDNRVIQRVVKLLLPTVVDRSWGRPEGSLFNSYYTEVKGNALIFSLDCSTLPLYTYLILQSVKQGGIK